VASIAKSSTIRGLKLGEGIPDGAAKVHQRWKYDALALCVRGHVIRRIGWSRMRVEKLKQVGGADTCGDSFDHDRSEAAITSKEKNCRNSNPVSFVGVEEPPSTDQLPLGIAKNRKRQFVLASNPIRLLNGIHGHCGDANTEAAEIIEKVPEFRQLTEAKRSPIAPIKNQQKRTIGQQGREGAGCPSGIGESKILGQRTDLRVLDFVHAHSESDSSGRFSRNL
jgi:hypothetical protein